MYEGETEATTINDDDSETVAMIKELLETRIRPAVQEDGGDIVFVAFDEATGVVTIKMLGACDGCPSSSITLKSGVENMIKVSVEDSHESARMPRLTVLTRATRFKHYVPEVTEIREAEPDEAEKEGLKAFNKLENMLSN